MSTTVDSKVLEMRFDNRNFERNVSTTMSTLDKLKAKLGFKGATKGLEDVSSAAKKVDLSGIGKSADTVGLRFNAMYTIADQALRNITNSAMQAGKNIMSALTIDPVKTGLSEYETKINAIQVIKANTRAKYGGDEIKQMADIEAALSELNDYADRTIYNYTQMTSNVGKFVAQGLGVNEATKAVQGLANLAGASGASAEDMARATYQMSQSLGGTIRKIDWNSLRNANMATVELKNTLMDLARVEGIDIDGMMKKKSFEDTLESGWLSGKLFTKAMNIYSDVYSEAELKAMGFKDEQVKNFKALAKTASEATTEVKTFSQLWDVLKETAQSGWTQTWELIIGDFDTAKKMFTNMQNYFSDIINGWSKARNWVVEGVLNFTKPWSAIMDKLDGAGLTGIKKMVDGVKEAIHDLEYYKKIVSEVWRGNWKRSDTGRYGLLEKAGYNHKVVQDLVNKTRATKSGRNLTMEDVEASYKKYGITMDKTTESAKKGSKAVDEMTFALENLSDEELKNAGLTKEEIKLFRDIAAEAKRTGISFDEMVEKMSTVTGRKLLIDSFKNAWSGVLGVAKAVGGAFADIFPAPSIPRIYTMIESLNKFSEKLRLTDKDTGKLNDTGKKLKRVFEGVFAVIDIIVTILGGAFRIAFKIVSQVLDYFGVSVLDAAAWIGDLLVKFHDWFESLFDISGLLETVGPLVKKAARAVSDWFAAFKKSEGMQKAIQYVKDLGTSIKDWWTGLKDAEDLPKTIAEGIVNFFSNLPKIVSTIFSNVWSAITGSFGDLKDTPFGGFIAKIQNGLSIAGQTIVELGKILLAKLNGFLSAHGFQTISEDSIAGLVQGLKNGASKVWNAAVEIAKQLVAKVKEFLGIHSPSTVFAAIGGFIIAGLIAGLQNGIPDSLGAVKDVFQPMIDWLKGIDWGALFTAGMSVGILVVMNKIGNALSVFEGLGDMFENIGTAIKDLGKGFKKLSGAAKNWALSKVITSIAIAIGVLAASLWVLSTVEPGRLWSAVGAIGVLTLVMGGLIAGLMALSKKVGLEDMGGFSKMSVMLVTLAGSLLIVAIALRVLSGIENTDGVLASMIGIMILVAGVMKATQYAGKDIDKVGGTLLKIALAIGILAIVAKMLSGMTWDELGRAGAGLAGLVGVIALLMVITMIPGKNIDQIGTTLLKISAAIALLAVVAKVLAGMTWAEMGKAAAGLGGLIGVITLLVLIMWLAPAYVAENIGKTLLGIAGAMAILTIVAKIIAGMSWGEMGKAAVGLLGLAVVIAILVKIVKSVEKDAPKIAGTLLALSVSIGILGLVVALLGMLSIEHLAKGLGAIIVLGLVMQAMIKSTQGASDCKGNLIAMTVAIGIMALSIGLLSFIDWTKLAPAVAGMVALMGMFALIIKSSKDVNASVGPLIVMTVAIGLIATAIYLLAGLPVENVLGSALALSAVMLALAGTMKILSSIKSIKLGALVTFGAMIVALYAVVGALALMEGLENAKANAMVLGAFMAVLSVATVIIAAAGAIIAATGGMALLGLVSLLGIIAALYAVVDVLAIMDGLQNAEANVGLLVTLMSALMKLMVVLAIVGPFALVGVAAVGALIGLIVAVGALALAVGALVTTFPQLQTFLDTGIPILVQMAGGLGKMIGAFIANLAGEIMVTLPLLGLCLSQFMTNAMPFIMGAKLVDESVLLGVGILAGAVLALTAADLITGVVSFLQGGSSFADLGTQLSLFMMNAMPFITAAAMITPEMLSGVKALAETILILTAANVIEGLTSFITGGSSLENFAAQLPILGAGLAAFSASLGTFTEDQMTTVNCAAKAIKTLAKASSEIPNTGGLLGDIVGENDLGTFAAQFPVLGSGLRNFLTNVGTFTDQEVATVNCAAQAIKSLAEASSEIPNTGGWLGAIVGENDLSTFASQFPILGAGLRGFLTNVGEFTDAQVSTVDCAANAIKTLAKASSEIPNTGGWLGAIVGENDLGTFASQFPVLGSGLKGFLDNAGAFSDEQVATVKCAASAIKSLASASKSIPNTGGLLAAIVGDNSLGKFASQFPSVGKGLKGFSNNVGTFSEQRVASVKAAVSALKAIATLGKVGFDKITGKLSSFSDKLPALGTGISSFTKKLPTVETLKNSITKLNWILDAVKKIGNANTGVLSTFAKNLKTVGEDAVKKFVGAFSSDAAKTDIEADAKALADKAVSGAKSKYDAMKSAGSYLIDGFAQGITANTWRAEARAKAMAKAAEKAAREELKINSPSKVFKEIGSGVPEGFALGIDEMGALATKSSSNMAKNAIDIVGTSISRISDLVSSDIDSQPTIRPVLDLSDIQSGASALNSMLNMDSSVGVRTNLGAISSMMSMRGQNGSNADIVSAIDKLNKKMDNMGNTTNNIINGVTYDDGSNINDAVATLVRAARIERRV